MLWSGCAASHTPCSFFSCVSSGAVLLSLEHAQLKANSIGIDVLAAAHGLLVAYYGRTELWTMRETKKVFVRRWGICSRFSELLAKPRQRHFASGAGARGAGVM